MEPLHVPEDVLIEILSRVPVKSLLQFRYVCKSWCALIKDPSFIQKHLLFNYATLKENDVPLIVSRSVFRTLKRKYSLIGNETLEVSPCAAFQSFKYYFFDIVGFCDGIYFMEDIEGRILLCNPALRELRPLPKIPPIPKKKTRTEAIGFCFDFKTNDYKLVAVRRGWDVRRGRDLDDDFNHVWLYSLSSDSWRKLETDLPSRPWSFIGLQTLNNGHFYVWAQGMVEGTPDFLLSFDLGSEVFFQIPMPVSDKIDQVFAVFNESIAAVVLDLEGSDEMGFCFDIWVMKECDVDKSWTKLFRIEPLLQISRVLGLRKNGKILLEKMRERNLVKLVLYDLRSQEFTKNLRIIENEDEFQVVTYMESLVSIRRRN